MSLADSLEPADEGATASQPQRQWQPPSVALNRFTPSAGARRTVAEIAAIARYGFRAAGIGLLLLEGTGAELVSHARMTSIPNGPAWLSGLMNLRGNLVPMVDLNIALDIRSADKVEAQRDVPHLVLVFGKGERAIGVLIDTAPQALKKLATITQLPPLPERLAAHAGRGYVEEQQFWVEFKHESFFDSLASAGTGT
jgi:twitching motility protein PilI